MNRDSIALYGCTLFVIAGVLTGAAGLLYALAYIASAGWAAGQ